MIPRNFTVLRRFECSHLSGQEGVLGLVFMALAAAGVGFAAHHSFAIFRHGEGPRN
jgi:hypothetical protein